VEGGRGRPQASITARIWPKKQILEKLVPRIAERFAAKDWRRDGGKEKLGLDV